VLTTVTGILPEASGPATPKHGYSFRPFRNSGLTVLFSLIC
jgi:hypothetical protein